MYHEDVRVHVVRIQRCSHFEEERGIYPSHIYVVIIV